MTVQRLTILAFLVGASCAPTITSFRAPDGRIAYSIDCQRSQTECLQAIPCQGAYTLLASSGTERPIYFRSGTSAFAGVAYHGTVIVECQEQATPALPKPVPPLAIEHNF